MKKFLSSLLALTMILSLVIVPANAAGVSDDSDSSATYRVTGKVTVSADKTNVNGGENVTFTANTSKLKVEKQKESSSSDSDSQSDEPAVEWETVTTGVTWGYSWTVDSGSAESDATTDTFKKTFNKPTNGQDATPSVSCTVTLKINNQNIESSSVTVPEGSSLTGSKSVTVKAPAVTIKANGTAIADSSTAVEILKDGKLELTAEAAGVNNPDYRWTVGSDVKSTSSTYSVSTTSKTDSDVTVTCNVYEGKYDSTSNSTPVATATCKYKIVEEDLRWNVSPISKSVTLTKKGETKPVTATLEKKAAGGTWNIVNGQTYSFDLKPSGIATLSNQDTSNGSVTVTLQNEGNVTLTVSTEYKGAKQSVDIKVSGELLSASLKEVTNGDKLEFDYDDLATLANKLLPENVKVKSGGYITLKSYPTSANTGGTLYLESTQLKGASKSLSTDADLTFYAQAGFIGNANLELAVTGDDNQSYTVYVTIPVTPAGEIKETVTGTSTNKEVTFTNSDYACLYYSYSKPDYKDYFDGNKVSNFEGPVKEDKTVTVPASKFNNSKTVTLYVVGLDKYGVASTGTIEVSQKSYAIEYSVVAGESVTFSQKDFESFLEDIADDSSDYNSRKDTLELSYVKFSLPNSTREGVLYEGKSKIDRNDKVEDLDKVSFESVAKAKDTITISFTAYGKLYKDGASKGKDVDYSGNVVISVVKEDIVFEVGVNSAVKLGSDKFIDFLRDSDKSYKKADLDYVTFDVGKNSAITSYFNGTGALYRYYNGSTGINSTVSAKDEFYYNPKTSSKHYDLDDVTYVTSKFAKVGDIVYIPFTAYGTKSGQKAEGTLAIKVKQTMNFVDVRPGDYFYDSVQWAVNLDITKGTSATTFSPKQGCTRAQIVTFLWRAANSPAPRSSTNKFTDVYATTHADYMKAIIWATEQGITTGTGNGKFSPDATCTRAQIVTFLYRFKNNPAVYGSLNFSDVNKTEHAAFYNAILWAVNNKITTGYGNGIFDPNGTCNRGDAVTFLYRALA